MTLSQRNFFARSGETSLILWDQLNKLVSEPSSYCLAIVKCFRLLLHYVTSLKWCNLLHYTTNLRLSPFLSGDEPMSSLLDQSMLLHML